jgi:hypothetical protein
MYARSAWARAPYASPEVPAPPVVQLPPPVPGGTTQYVVTTSGGDYPWALGGWAGPALPVPSLPGGLVVVPDSDSGTVRVLAWWPDVAAVELVRLHPDGTRVPVRGAYPATIAAGATRRNYATNPSLTAGLNGYVPADGNPTLSQIADASSGTAALRATISAAGLDGVAVPHALPVSTFATVGFALRLSARASTVTLSIGYTDAGGTALTTQTATLASDQVNASVSTWSRQVVRLQAPPFAATVGTIKVVATGMPAAGTLDLDSVTIEQGQTDGSYADGDTLGGLWTGTAGLSTSVISAVQTIVDGEAPQDVPVSYMVVVPSFTGGSAVSPLVTLASNDRSWITHPGNPSVPLSVAPSVAPTLSRAAVQAAVSVIGRAYPVVVSAARSSITGTLTVNTSTFAERDALYASLADGSPIYFRAPGDYGLGYGLWLAIGDVSEDPGGRPQWSPGRTLTLPFTQVDVPLGPNTFAAA